jgi:hypothetical protein
LEGPYIVVYSVVKATRTELRRRTTFGRDSFDITINCNVSRTVPQDSTIPNTHYPSAQKAHTHRTRERGSSEEEAVSDVETEEEENLSVAEREVDRQEPRRRGMRKRRPPDRFGEWEYITDDSE